MTRWLFALALLLGAAAEARTFRGVVTHVVDGDTLWVRPAEGGKPVELRLLDVDAPEGCQPFGDRSADALRQRVLRERVRVRTHGEDDYHRQLAHVEHRGEDVNAWLVRNGLAWSSTFHRKAGPYAALQEEAQEHRVGLWAARDAEEPRHFRKRVGRCYR